MFSAFKNMFGVVSVKELPNKNIILIDGIPADFVRKLIQDLVKIRKINRNLFINPESKYTLEFYSFFALEVVYLLNEILVNNPSYRATRIIVKILDEMKKNTWIANVDSQDITSIIDLDLLKNIKWTMMPHQLEFLNKYGDIVPRYELNGLLLASSAGSGKTIMDLAVAAAIVPRSVAEVKIIISPKNALELVWEDTINKVFYTTPTSWVSVTPGAAPLDCEYYVFHYEALDRAKALCDALKTQNKKYFVIVDESHNFNEIGSKRTQLLIDICTMTKSYSIWASGSPLKKSKLEMIPLLRSIDPKFTPEVELAFKKIYGGDEEVASAIMYHRMGFYAFKIDKATVIKESATPVRIKVKLKDDKKYLLDNIRNEMREFIEARLIEIKKDIKRFHDEFDECLAEHEKTLKTNNQKAEFTKYKIYIAAAKKQTMATRPDIEVLQYCKKYETDTLLPSLSKESQKKFKECRSVVKSLLLKLRGEALGRVVTKRRAECAAELSTNCNLEDIISNGIAKSMVFSSYVEPLNTATKYLKAKGFETANVYGDTAKQVTSIVREFHDNEAINPILATYMSLSTAVPVLAANQVILLDIPFRNYILDQTVARCLRLGQTNPVFLYSIVLDTGDAPNISTRAGDILAACQLEIARVLGREFGGIQAEEFSNELVDENDIVEEVNIDDTLHRVEAEL